MSLADHWQPCHQILIKRLRSSSTSIPATRYSLPSHRTLVTLRWINLIINNLSEFCWALIVAQLFSTFQSYPAPVVFVPRQCDPPDTTTTSSPSTTSPTTKMATSTSPAVPTSASPVASTSTSPVTSTQPRTTSSTTPSSTTGLVTFRIFSFHSHLQSVV